MSHTTATASAIGVPGHRPARAPAVAAGCGAVALAGFGVAGASPWLAVAALASLALAVTLAMRVVAEGDPLVVAWPFLAAQGLISGFYVWAAWAHCCAPLTATTVVAAAGPLFVAAGLWSGRLRSLALLTATAIHAIAFFVSPSLTVASTALLLTSASLLFVDDRPRSRLVVWDDTCSFCRSSVAVLTRLDWLHVHRFEGSSRDDVLIEARVTRGEAEEELKLWDGRRTLGGFDAIRGILESMPAGFFWARVLAFPPLASIGRAAYRGIARRRHCLLPPR